MIRHLSHSEIDKPLWDQTISLCGNVYAFSWYLDIVHPGWEALVDDDYETVMPLTGGRKFGINYLFQPFFVQQLGLFSQQLLTQETAKRFLEGLPKKYRFAEIRLNEGNLGCFNTQLTDIHRNVILDLNKGYNAISAAYHSNTRRNLAKAEANRLQFREMVKPEQVIALFRADRGATLKKWGDKEYAVLKRLADEALRRGNAFVVGVTDCGSDQLLSAAIFMKTDSRITFLFSGNCVVGKQKQAMCFMLDQVIRQNAGRMLTFDFEGSDNEQLARFYLGFGGSEVAYPSLAFNHLPALGKLALRCWKKGK